MISVYAENNNPSYDYDTLSFDIETCSLDGKFPSVDNKTAFICMISVLHNSKKFLYVIEWYYNLVSDIDFDTNIILFHNEQSMAMAFL